MHPQRHLRVDRREGEVAGRLVDRVGAEHEQCRDPPRLDIADEVEERSARPGHEGQRRRELARLCRHCRAPGSPAARAPGAPAARSGRPSAATARARPPAPAAPPSPRRARPRSASLRRRRRSPWRASPAATAGCRAARSALAPVCVGVVSAMNSRMPLAPASRSPCRSPQARALIACIGPGPSRSSSRLTTTCAQSRFGRSCWLRLARRSPPADRTDAPAPAAGRFAARRSAEAGSARSSVRSGFEAPRLRSRATPSATAPSARRNRPSSPDARRAAAPGCGRDRRDRGSRPA